METDFLSVLYELFVDAVEHSKTQNNDKFMFEFLQQNLLQHFRR